MDGYLLTLVVYLVACTVRDASPNRSSYSGAASATTTVESQSRSYYRTLNHQLVNINYVLCSPMSVFCLRIRKIIFITGLYLLNRFLVGQSLPLPLLLWFLYSTFSQ